MLCVDCSSSTLSALNLGDSGFRLFRQLDSEAGAPRLEMGSRPQQHFFNCPFQLGGDNADRPRNGDRYTHAVQPGDLIVLATDGLFDNLFDDEIGALLAKGGTIEQLSERVASTARNVSFDMKRRSPFTVEARAQGYNMPGGKVDDVAVVLIRVLNGDVPGGAQDEDEDARSRRMSNELRSKL
jgi:protein phosphatase PTC7